MDKLSQLISKIKSGEVPMNKGIEEIKKFMFTNLDYAIIDDHRESRVGYPEIIFGEGKTTEQILGIAEHMYNNSNNILGTRINSEVYEAVASKIPEAK